MEAAGLSLFVALALVSLVNSQNTLQSLIGTGNIPRNNVPVSENRQVNRSINRKPIVRSNSVSYSSGSETQSVSMSNPPPNMRRKLRRNENILPDIPVPEVGQLQADGALISPPNLNQATVNSSPQNINQPNLKTVDDFAIVGNVQNLNQEIKEPAKPELFGKQVNIPSAAGVVDRMVSPNAIDTSALLNRQVVPNTNIGNQQTLLNRNLGKGSALLQRSVNIPTPNQVSDINSAALSSNPVAGIGSAAGGGVLQRGINNLGVSDGLHFQQNIKAPRLSLQL